MSGMTDIQSAEERKAKFASLLSALVDEVIDQTDKGWAVDVEEQADRLATMAADHEHRDWTEMDVAEMNPGKTSRVP